ncbi:hypothetical protein ANN_02495 [Periplaneta americana]|uniref:Uncharacterized protein n=1 Tax=Periplaneta americana TaxID=6978 RepID=A0ABQ8TXK6_PERAM|nr:hypothetical protein ANN_02495 [Periplaneta americana]
MAGLCEGGNEPPGSLKAGKRAIRISAVHFRTSPTQIPSSPSRDTTCFLRNEALKPHHNGVTVTSKLEEMHFSMLTWHGMHIRPLSSEDGIWLVVLSENISG